MNKVILYSALLGTSVMSYQARGVELDGYLTAGLAVHNQSQSNGSKVVYLDEITDDVTFLQDSKFGLQVTADVAENMQAVAQILASAEDDNYSMDIEWAYLDYTASESTSIRAGRIKQPVFLISDYLEVGYAYPWIRPPAEAYSNMPVDSIIGVQLLYQARIGEMNFGFQPYFGSNTEGVPGQPTVNFFADNYVGMALRLENRAFTFQVSTFQTDVSTVDTGSNSNFNSEGTATLSVASLSWDIANFVGYSEYTTRDIKADDNTLSTFGATGSGATNGFNDVPFDALFSDQDGYYVTLGYRMGKYLPHLTYATMDSTPAGTPAQMYSQGARQESITLGLRYELNDSAALKMEYQTTELDNNTGNMGLYQPIAATSGFVEDKMSLLSVAVDIIF
jgi:hypothetical protein